jgi:tripartite-type tricarboxylate transporter receptor subunit TctC
MCAKRTSGKVAFVVLSALFFLMALSALSTAQENGADAYPSQAVRIIVGFTPGGAPDITARVIAEKLNEAWGRPVIVENRPGAGSELAARYVAESPADGYTLLSITNAHAVVPAINAEVPYDAVKSFAGVTMTSIAPNWLLVSPSLGVRSLGEFITFAKQKPNQLNYGSAGVGSFMQFAAAIFNDAVGIQAQHVPYKGPPEAIADTADSGNWQDAATGIS